MIENPALLIGKKRDGESLTAPEIQFLVDGLLDGRVDRAQMASLLMAIFLKGFSTEETAALTKAMLHSGKVFEFNDQTVIDKHSTGGVGDKTSFILAPLAAACGVKVPMISGRGLGHTGGTVDKMESIPGFNPNVDLDTFQKVLLKNNLVMSGQTEEIAPADKLIYGLRDTTATVESIPLITASIMSKKLAEGASGFVMDIKTGSGAFMQNLEDSRALATSLRETALHAGKNIITMVTDMDWPLGLAIGNSLEIIECIEVLKGKGPSDLTELSLALTGGMVHLAGLAKSHDEGIELARQALDSGRGLDQFKLMIEEQGGDPAVLEDYSKLPVAGETTQWCAPSDGWLVGADCKELGLAIVHLGGGRKKPGDPVDHAVGITLHKIRGDQLKKGDPILTFHHHLVQNALVDELIEKFSTEVFRFSDTQPTEKKELILETQVSWATP